MNNPTIRYVDLQLKGEKEVFKLALDFNAIAEAEEACGVNLFQALDYRRATAAQWRAMLWAAMLKAKPTVTLEEAGQIIHRLLLNDPKGINKLRQAIDATFAASMPAKESEDPSQPDQESAGN